MLDWFLEEAGLLGCDQLHLDSGVGLDRASGRLLGTCFVRGSDSIRQRLLIRPHFGDFGPVGTESEVRKWIEAAGLELVGARRSGPMLLFEAAACPRAQSRGA